MFCDSLDRPVHGIRSGPQRIQWYLFGVSFEIRHRSAPICRLDRRKFSWSNTRNFLPSGPSRSIQSLEQSSAMSIMSSDRP